MQARFYRSRFMKISISLGIAVAVLVVGWRHFQVKFYQAQLPKDLSVKGVHLLHVEDGLRDGCGVVIFDMSLAMIQALQSSGLDALKEARECRGGPLWQAGDIQYTAWQSTPYVEHDADSTPVARDDRWLVGLACGGLDDAWSANIHKALSSPGSYVSKSTSGKGGLIVIPALRVVVLSLMD
jgi:hypothetical protein